MIQLIVLNLFFALQKYNNFPNYANFGTGNLQNLHFFVRLIWKNGTIFANFAENTCVCRKKAVPLRRFCVRRDERVRV
jgi:hypothetical protein